MTNDFGAGSAGEIDGVHLHFWPAAVLAFHLSNAGMISGSAASSMSRRLEDGRRTKRRARSELEGIYAEAPGYEDVSRRLGVGATAAGAR